MRKSAAKEADNVNPRPRVNTERAIVKKTKLSRYSTEEPGEFLIEKNIVPVRCQSLIALGLERPFRMPKISLKRTYIGI